MSSEFAPIADALYRERVLRARRTPPERRMAEGLRLFDLASEMTRAGIRAQNPTWGEEQVEAELRRRLRIARILENTPM